MTVSGEITSHLRYGWKQGYPSEASFLREVLTCTKQQLSVLHGCFCLLGFIYWEISTCDHPCDQDCNQMCAIVIATITSISNFRSRELCDVCNTRCDHCRRDCCIHRNFYLQFSYAITITKQLQAKDSWWIYPISGKVNWIWLS